MHRYTKNIVSYDLDLCKKQVGIITLRIELQLENDPAIKMDWIMESAIIRNGNFVWLYDHRIIK